MAGIGIAVACQVGAELRLVVHLIPDDRVRLTSGARCAHRENEPSVPCHQKQPQNLDGAIESRFIMCNLQTPYEVNKKSFLIYLASLLAVREVAVSWEPTGSEGFAWVWVLWALKGDKVHYMI